MDRSVTGGGEQWARRQAARAIQELDPSEADPIVFGSLSPASADGTGISTTLWTALSIGLATVTVRTDPTGPTDATIAIAVESWPGIAPTLRLDSAGDPEDRYPATVTAGAQRIESTRLNRDDLVSFFRECARRIAL